MGVCVTQINRGSGGSEMRLVVSTDILIAAGAQTKTKKLQRRRSFNPDLALLVKDREACRELPLLLYDHCLTQGLTRVAARGGAGRGQGQSCARVAGQADRQLFSAPEMQEAAADHNTTRGE